MSTTELSLIAMARWSRWIITLLLAVALPLQGVAAATMRLCAPDAAVTQAVHAGHDHAAPSHHAVQPADGAAQPDHHAAPAKSRCSVCAACCAAALPATPVAFGADARLETFVAQASDPAVVFLTAGPERPPRTAPR